MHRGSSLLFVWVTHAEQILPLSSPTARWAEGPRTDPGPISEVVLEAMWIPARARWSLGQDDCLSPERIAFKNAEGAHAVYGGRIGTASLRNGEFQRPRSPQHSGEGVVSFDAT